MLAATGVESEPVLLALLALLIHQERDYFFAPGVCLIKRKFTASSRQNSRFAEALLQCPLEIELSVWWV